MSRTGIVLALVFALSAFTEGARADTSLLSHVATCTGRLSAYLELHWAHRDPRAEKVAKLHAHMTDLMFALTDARTNRKARTRRTDAKKSFRSLLISAGAGARDSKGKRAQMATAKARHDLRHCAGLISSENEVDAALGLSADATLLTGLPTVPGISQTDTEAASQ